MYRDGKGKDIVVYGDCDLFTGCGTFMYKAPREEFSRNKLIQYWFEYFIPQPSVFMPGESIRKNLINESLNFVMDWDLWLRLSLQHDFVYLKATLSKFNSHNDSKWGKSREKFLEEQKRIVQLHHKNFSSKLYFHLCRIRWEIRRFYHNLVRPIGLKILRLCVGELLYARLRNYKKDRFPFLSKFR
jgi:hypothetical protein